MNIKPKHQAVNLRRMTVLKALALLAGVSAFTATVLGGGPTTAPASQSPVSASQPASSSQEDLVLGFAMQNEPDIYKWLLVVKEKDPKRYGDLIREFTPEVVKLNDIKARNRGLFDLTVEDRRLYFQSLQLSRDNPASTGPAEQQRHHKLEAVVQMQFEVRQKLRKIELNEAAARIEALQKQLDRLKTELDQRERNKETLIEQRVKDLSDKNAKMEW